MWTIVESLGRASQVCKVWCNLANEASLWRKFCSNPKWRLSRSGEQKQIIQHMLPDGSVNVSIVIIQFVILILLWKIQG